jgi:hypothetical protein
MGYLPTSPLSTRRTAAVLAVLAFAATSVLALAPAGAQQGAAKPAPGCAGEAFKDPKGDGEPSSLDVISGFFLYDPAKGDKALTANVVINDLSDAIPAGATGVVWTMVWDYEGAPRFVRTLIDFSGGPYYEYGTYLEPGPNLENPLPLGRFAREGNTEGSMATGKDGVVSMVVPKAIGGDAGKTLAKPYALAASATQVVPGSVPAPTRGLSSPEDYGPDAGETGGGGTSFKVEACPAGSAGSGAATTLGTPTSDKPLPVKLLSKSKKAVKKGASLALKLRSSEKITQVAAQLRKGKSVYGKGKMATLDGTATLKVKISKKLAKGKYTLDIAGNDASGAHRLTAASITIR